MHRLGLITPPPLWAGREASNKQTGQSPHPASPVSSSYLPGLKEKFHSVFRGNDHKERS